MTISVMFCPYAAHLVVVHELHWWGFETWRIPKRHGPVFHRTTAPGRRAPARACRKDARRWKRRRFLHKLRRST